MRTDERIASAALTLIQGYTNAHPELKLTQAVEVAALLTGEGIKMRLHDEGDGLFTITDDAGVEVLRLDLRSWRPPAEG